MATAAAAAAAVSSSKKLWRWGILGCGKISWDFSMALSGESRSLIQACAARRLESAQSFAEEFGVAHAFGSYSELLNDPTVDVVYVGTIHPTHHDLVIEALDKGKHVLCEKPAGMNAKQVKSMIDCARQSGRFFAEACWTRYFPAVRRLRTFIDGNHHDQTDLPLGHLVSYNGNFGLKMPDPSEAPRLWNNDQGGGSLLDIGIYPVQFIPFAFGTERTPVELKAIGDIHPTLNVDTMVNAAFKYSEREFGMIHCNFQSTSSLDYTFTFERGYVNVPTHHPERLEIVLFDSLKTMEVSKRIVEEYPLVCFPEFTRNGQRMFNFSNSNGLYYQASGVIDALEQGQCESSFMKWADSMRTHEIMDEIRRQIGMVYKEDSDDLSGDSSSSFSILDSKL